MAKRKQTSIDLSTKLKIIEKYESEKKTQKQLAEEFGIGKSTVNGIINNKEAMTMYLNVMKKTQFLMTWHRGLIIYQQLT